MFYFIAFFLTLANFVYASETHFGPIKAVIFDCDGTLIETEEIIFKAWHHAFQKQGYELTKQEYLFLIKKHALAGLPAAHTTFAKIGADLIGHDCAQELYNAMSSLCNDLRSSGYPPIEATVEFLHRLAKEKEKLGIKLGLASGGKKHLILIHLRNLGIEKYFDVILSGFDDLVDYVDSEGTNKPKPYIYLHAAKLLGVSPNECVAIEDSRAGVTSAVSAGCLCIAVPNTYTMDQDLSHAALKLESFSGISPIQFLKMMNSY